MDKWVLIIGHDKEKFNKIQMECLDCNLLLRMVNKIGQATSELTQSNRYLLIIILAEGFDILEVIESIRKLTNIPVLIMKEQYDGNEKIAAIRAGADEYIQWPEKVREGIASCYALIRRFTVLNRSSEKNKDVISHGNLIINLYYHKVFIDAYELELPRREFDLLYLLVSNPGKVFTFEQLSEKVWGEDYEITENSLHSCIRRIRRKLESVPENICCIENIRGVGYYIRQNKIFSTN